MKKVPLPSPLQQPPSSSQKKNWLFPSSAAENDDLFLPLPFGLGPAQFRDDSFRLSLSLVASFPP